VAENEGHAYRYERDAPDRKRRIYRLTDAVAIRLESRADPLPPLYESPAKDLLSKLDIPLHFPDIGVVVLRARDPKKGPLLAGSLLTLLSAALHGLPFRLDPAYGRDPKGGCVLWSPRRIIVRIRGAAGNPPPWLLTGNPWTFERELEYAPGAFVLRADPAVLAPEDLPARLLAKPEVVSAYLVLQAGREASSLTPPPESWHLATTKLGGREVRASANVARAWARSVGRGVCIALLEPRPIDEKHGAFGGRVEPGLDMLVSPPGPMPPPAANEDHGTHMAGIALAEVKDVAGVAPAAMLLGIRIGTSLGSLEEADAFHLAATRNAHVISCSWNVDQECATAGEMQDHTCWAMRFALRRGGPNKTGCPIVFSAGNGKNGRVKRTVEMDPYASFPGVITVGACSSWSRVTSYSNPGRRVWCAFPAAGPDRTFTFSPGILTTVPGGGRDTITGRTSGACAGVAGVIALILSVAPGLGPRAVRRILRGACKEIDLEGGEWKRGHSKHLGYGRIDANCAVRMAMRCRGKKRFRPVLPA
jgi:hypothetical protein